MRAKIVSLEKTATTPQLKNTYQLTLQFDDDREAERIKFDSENTQDVYYNVDIKRGHKKRSLDANGLLWKMADEIAKVIRATKEEVYVKAVKDVGVYDDVCVMDRAVPQFCNNWSKKGLGWFTETYESRLHHCTNVRVYYGSSSYDAAQMARLIDYIMDEAKELGIDVDRESVDKAKGEWKND